MASLRRDAALRQIDRLFGEGTLGGLSDARLLERYLAERDELAFEALVRRHGSMVLGVCRRVLDDPNDADDAFQAAFLLLARKARSIRDEHSVGGWLHRVAWRIALQIRSDAARRRDREHRAAAHAGGPIASGPRHDDTVAVIHQEIDRLPDRYRRPVVLCYLEDMTYQQAADQLRWSEAMTRGRLARARDLLRARLTRRGVTLTGAGLSIAVAGSPSLSAAVPDALLTAAVRAARHLALGESAAVSTTTVALVKQAARAMMVARLKAAAAVAVVVVTLAGVGSGLAAMGIGAVDPRPAGSGRVAKDDPPARAVSDRARASTGETITFHGAVLDPARKPAVGAAVFTIAPRAGGGRVEPVLRAKVDADGGYRFVIPREEFGALAEAGPWAALTVLAIADGLGPDWIELKKPPDEPVNLRLVDDSVPISGRILDLQGRPVVGAKVTRGVIRAEFNEDIEPYLKLVREDPFRASNHNPAKSYWGGMRLLGQPESVMTDAEGRFRLTGIGRDRIVDLAVEGPTIQSATITAMIRNAAAVSSPKGAFAAKTIYGATFDHLVPPGRALTGVVRDKRTGRPMAGIEVCGWGTNARVTTDADGRYMLPGFPKGKSYGLMALAGDRPPYFVTSRNVPDDAGLDPLRADIDCVPGIPMRLKLIDKETGLPAKGAEVAYWPLYPNSHVREVPGYAPVNGSGPYNQGIMQADGAYLLGVLPGPGAVVVRTAPGRYRPACVDPRAYFGVKAEKKPGEGMIYGDRDSLYFASGEGIGGMPQSQFSAIVLVNPPEDSGPIAAEAMLERDPRREVRVLGPDDKPQAGVTAEGEGAEPTKTPGVMTVSGLNPVRPKRFLFRHAGHKLVGFLLARGDEAEPYTVRLQPWGTIAGRLVDEQGQPRPRAELMTSDWQAAMNDPTRGILQDVKTDSEGRFRIEGLVPAQSYTGYAVGEEAMKRGFGVVIDRVVLQPGETRDLGDVRARPTRPEGGE
jgi:RNA polymerase sigma factor (sigma-70 family)